jgi:hypothetical protein
MGIDIETNYDKTVRIDRLTDVDSGDEGEEEYTTHIASLPCHIQPLDESFTEDITGQFGKDYLMFCASNDILEGDRVTEGSNVYRVVGVESFEFLGEKRHMEIRIREYND